MAIEIRKESPTNVPGDRERARGGGHGLGKKENPSMRRIWSVVPGENGPSRRGWENFLERYGRRTPGSARGGASNRTPGDAGDVLLHGVQ